MRRFFFPLMLAVFLACVLTACMQDSMDSVKVDGDVTTVFSTGSTSGIRSRTLTGISF